MQVAHLDSTINLCSWTIQTAFHLIITEKKYAKPKSTVSIKNQPQSSTEQFSLDHPADRKQPNSLSHLIKHEVPVPITGILTHR